VVVIWWAIQVIFVQPIGLTYYSIHNSWYFSIASK
jgi:hypothetical protein